MNGELFQDSPGNDMTPIFTICKVMGIPSPAHPQLSFQIFKVL
jgi:hypothetical protein